MSDSIFDPAKPAFIEYVRSDLDIFPEGLLFVRAGASPNDMPLLIVTTELSGTVTIYQIESKDA